jgi:hypothetical protein
VTSGANSNKGGKGSLKHSLSRAHRDDNPKESLKDLKLSHKIEKLKKKLNARKCHELISSSFSNENSDDRTTTRRTSRRALKELNLCHKIEKLKKKLNARKCHESTSPSFSNENSNDTTHDIKKKKGEKEDKRSYNSTSFNYDNLPFSNTFTVIPVDKVARFDRIDYNK